MQEVSEPAGRRPAQRQFAGVDLRRPKGYAAPQPSPAPAAASQGMATVAAAAAAEGEPCPRCESRDTKFCYYNNYNTAQPRHFCKGCRRYWTKGGTLRNVPVGGGTRKKPSSSSPSSYAAAAKPKRPYKKKRRVAPPEPAAPAPVASPAATDSYKAPTTATADSAKSTTNPTTTDAASEITELLVPAAEDDALTHLLHPDDAVALGLGLSDFSSGKGAALLEPDSFEWPASFDLGAACWGFAAGGFGDPVDPAQFLNLP
jgi:hypothetical protein